MSLSIGAGIGVLLTVLGLIAGNFSDAYEFPRPGKHFSESARTKFDQMSAFWAVASFILISVGLLALLGSGINYIIKEIAS